MSSSKSSLLVCPGESSPEGNRLTGGSLLCGLSGSIDEVDAASFSSVVNGDSTSVGLLCSTMTVALLNAALRLSACGGTSSAGLVKMVVVSKGFAGIEVIISKEFVI